MFPYLPTPTISLILMLALPLNGINRVEIVPLRV